VAWGFVACDYLVANPKPISRASFEFFPWKREGFYYLTIKQINNQTINLRVALVHDYLVEYGGAERVLETLCEMFPGAPIYTAFTIRGSTAWKQFKDRKIIESGLAPLLKFKKLYSPLRFLVPWVWEGFDFIDYDVVISSASWYITKGIIVPPDCKHISYIHTPPRYLYGLPTAIEWQRYPLVKLYANIVNKFLRKYDYLAAQRPDILVVNSANVQERVRRLYKRDSTVIYPPVMVEEIINKTQKSKLKSQKNTDYYLIVSRVVGAKGIDMAIEAANKLGVNLKIVGETAGLRWEEEKLKKLRGSTVEFVGRVEDAKLWQYYSQAKGFLALAKDEDFGMTVVEAQAAGTPVLAFYGGGYKETVIDGKTGLFFRDYTVDNLIEALGKFERMQFKRAELQENARKFDEAVFIKKINRLVNTPLFT